MENIKQLLKEVSYIVNANQKKLDEQRKRGEHFSIFEVLGIWSDEMKHSAVLAQFLNPKASHGMGDIFLKCFIDSIGITDLGINTEKCCVMVEHSFDGGRIDILIEEENKAIIIENKIYATDQYRQLIRYDEFAKARYKNNYNIIYLTLDGHEASENSAGVASDRVDYMPISYRVRILEWLTRCAELSYKVPLVRETLIQYRTLVQNITNQTMNTENTQELIKLITNKPENLRGCSVLATSLYDAQDYLYKTLFIKTLELITKERQLKGKWELCFYKVEKSYARYAGFCFFSEDCNLYKIGFEFQGSNHTGLIKGVVPRQQEAINADESSVKELREKGKEQGYNLCSNTWLFYGYQKYKSWGTTEFTYIYDKDSDLYKSIINDLCTIINLISG